MKPWRVVDRVATPEGVLELRQRGEHDFLILHDGRVLMTSAARRSEEALATRVCPELPPAARVLVAGLGMGYTLAAALQVLGPEARVTVAELAAQVVAWCRGPLAPLTGGALADPRVTVQVGDVAQAIPRGRWHAILLDLHEGPNAATQGPDDPCFGPAALRRTHRQLEPGGILAIWGEDLDPAFARAFPRAGYEVRVEKVGGGGRNHVLYLGRAIRPSP